MTGVNINTESSARVKKGMLEVEREWTGTESDYVRRGRNMVEKPLAQIYTLKVLKFTGRENGSFSRSLKSGLLQFWNSLSTRFGQTGTCTLQWLN